MKKINYSKYRNKKFEFDGISFDSKREAKRYQELSFLERSGEIRNLQMQVKYILIPAQYAEVNGKRKCIERECAYIADFVYEEAGKTVVEDTKGFRTKDYIIKRKLMLYVNGIRIVEI